MGRKTNITNAQPERGEISAGGITASNGPPGTNTQENWKCDALCSQRATGFMPVGGNQTGDRRNHNYKDKSTQRAPTGRNPLGPVRGTVFRREPKSRKAMRGTVREIQRDPIGYPDETQSVDNESGQALGGINLYEYVAGRAVVKTDPTGLVESYVTHEGIQIGHPRLVMGPWVKLPACPPGVHGCCVARKGTYRAFLGTIVASGNPMILGGGLVEELVKAAVKGAANLLPETKLVSLWTDDLSFSCVLYTYDMYATWGRTVIYSYCCGTDFVNSKLISDKKTVPTVIAVGASRSASDPNNLYLGGTTGASRKHLMESIWEMLHEWATAVKGE